MNISVKRLKKGYVIVLSAVLFAAYIGMNTYSIYRYASVDETRKADVAIVLGAATDGENVSKVYEERLNHAVELYNEGCVKSIILTGGVGDNNENSDAYAAKKYMEGQGIPQEDMLLEEKSTITQENLENSKQIMEDENLQTALIVSDPLHMKRSMLLAKDCDIEAYSSPTKTSAYKSKIKKLTFLVREAFFYIGYKWYRITDIFS